MASPLDMQLQNAKTSILFMQQDHANTLQSLHQEIQKLQKKCAEMTFELAMKDDVDEEAYQEENQRLDKLLREKTIECNSIQELLEKKEKRIGVLELQLRAQEKRYTDEIKQKNLKINTMKNDLDDKSRIIAVLSNEIQQVNLRSSQENLRSVQENQDGAVTPVPPKGSRPSSRRKVSIKKPLGPHLGYSNRQGPVKAVQFDCGQTISRGEGLHDGASHNNSDLISESQRPRTPVRTICPEPTDSKVFVVRPKECSKDVVVRRKLPVLPPIVNQGDQTSIIGSSKQTALLNEVPGLRINNNETLAINSLIHQESLREIDNSNSE